LRGNVIPHGAKGCEGVGRKIAHSVVLANLWNGAYKQDVADLSRQGVASLQKKHSYCSVKW